MLYQFAIACLLPLVALAGGASAHAGQATADGLPLLLLQSIPSPSSAGQLISFQEPKVGGCKFLGVLVHQSGQPATYWEKLSTQAIGNSGRWSISITRQVCSSVVKEVALTVPLRNIASQSDYDAGATVLAFPAK